MLELNALNDTTKIALAVTAMAIIASSAAFLYLNSDEIFVQKSQKGIISGSGNFGIAEVFGNRVVIRNNGNSSITELKLLIDGKEAKILEMPSFILPGQSGTYVIELNSTTNPTELAIASNDTTIRMDVKDSLFFSCTYDFECATPPIDSCISRTSKRKYFPDGSCEKSICDYGYIDSACDGNEICKKGTCIPETEADKCVNGFTESGESCGEPAGASAEICDSKGCRPLETREETADNSVCGNGIREGGEKCDIIDLNGETCSSVLGSGYAGVLGCSWNCKSFLTSTCSFPETSAGSGGSSAPYLPPSASAAPLPTSAPTATVTPAATASASPTPSASSTPSPSATPNATASPTANATSTPTTTPSPTATATATPAPTATPTPTPTPAITPTPTAIAGAPFVYSYSLPGTPAYRWRGGWFNATADGVFKTVKFNLLPSQPANIQISSDLSRPNMAGAKTERKENISWLQDLHVDIGNGNDTNSGSASSPFRTIQKVFDSAAAGTRIIIHAGTYHSSSETLAIARVHGQPALPILVIAANRLDSWKTERTPVLSISKSGAYGLDIGKNYYIIDGLEFRSDLAAGLIRVYPNPSGVIIQNSLFNATSGSVSAGIRSRPWIVRNNTFIGDGFNEGITIDDGVFTFVYGNHFMENSGNYQYRFGCMGGCTFMNNIMEEVSSRYCCELYFSDGTLVINNLFYKYSPSSNLAMISTRLSSSMAILSNTAIAEPYYSSTGARKYGIQMHGIADKVYDNLFGNGEYGVYDYLPETYTAPQELFPGERARNDFRNNYLYNVSVPYFDTGSGVGSVSVSETFLGNYPSNIASAILPIDANFIPVSGSGAIDAAEPGTPVPVGGGSRADIGAFEYGATPWATFDGSSWTFKGVYDYQAKASISDSTPTFSWTFTDPDNDYSYSSGQYQYSFKAQVDTKPTFDSENLIESGTVNSSVSKWTVPVALSPGKYYFRVITSDNIEPSSFGPWSDPRYAFQIT